MTIYCLATTKIGKVMRRIIDKNVIPRQEEFSGDGLREVIVAHASGGATSATLLHAR